MAQKVLYRRLALVACAACAVCAVVHFSILIVSILEENDGLAVVSSLTSVAHALLAGMLLRRNYGKLLNATVVACFVLATGSWVDAFDLVISEYDDDDLEEIEVMAFVFSVFIGAVWISMFWMGLGWVLNRPTREKTDEETRSQDVESMAYDLYHPPPNDF